MEWMSKYHNHLLLMQVARIWYPLLAGMYLSRMLIYLATAKVCT